MRVIPRIGVFKVTSMKKIKVIKVEARTGRNKELSLKEEAF